MTLFQSGILAALLGLVTLPATSSHAQTTALQDAPLRPTLERPVTTASGQHSNKILPETAPSPVNPPTRLVSGPLNADNYTAGPGPIPNGHAENLTPGNIVSGAAHVVLPHPTDPNILYAGFTNGGIWKTTNALAASPTWTPQTDHLGSLSIGAIAFDPTDPTHQTLVAGAGRTSTLGQLGGPRIGIYRTVNGGANWSLVSGTSMSGRGVSGIVARGSIIVASVNIADIFTYSNIGIFRSIDTGATFSQISGTNGLPQGVCYDLAADPSSTTTLYTSVVFPLSPLDKGIFKSTDTGLNWTLVSNATINSIISNNTSNLEISVGNSNNVYAAIANVGRLHSVWRSGDGGNSWTSMDVPGTTEGLNFYGIHPASQGSIHLSLLADPNDSQVVYIGGDRQPRGNELVSPSFPNSIGANKTSGRLFRGNAAAAAGTQWVPITHSNSIPAFPNGGTASNSSPTPDSRDLAMDASGRLIEGSSGGVFARTNPNSNTGDWAALNGNLQTTEINNVAYDSVSNRIIAGSIDNGVIQQDAAGNWETVTPEDGGDVAVDDKSLAGSGQSIRYSSLTNLSQLVRRTYNSSGGLVSSTSVSLTGFSGSPSFITPVVLNRINPNRLLIATSTNLFESSNQGDQVTNIQVMSFGSSSFNGAGIDYGGRTGGVDNPDVIYAVAGSSVYVRTSPPPAAMTRYNSVASSIVDVVMDRNDYNTAYVVTSSQVHKTTNAGANWSNVTGDLSTTVGAIRRIEFIPTANGGTVVVGTQTGVYAAKNSAPTQWYQLGNNLPAGSNVMDLEYDDTDNVLVVGILGRGVWILPNANAVATVPVSMVSWEVQ